MRILWLKTELLHPIDKGGKIRTYQMLKELKKNHHITYLTLDDGAADADALEKAGEYAHEIITIPHRTAAKFSAKFYLELTNNLVSKLPYALQKYVSAEMRNAIEKLTGEKKYDVVVCDFLTPAVNLPLNLNAATLLFQHNVEAMIWRRHYEIAAGAPKKALMKMQWRRMFEYEKESCRRFDWVAAVSKEDAETMRGDYGIENVSDVPTGVDTEFFAPGGTIEKDEFNLVFTGSMDWMPNEDAILWFTEEILPLVRRQIPQISLTVVGRNPFPKLVEASKKDQAIVVTGRVPDVRPFMEKASVYIVPIRIGGGTRLKIYEAMAMELPIVSTKIGAEGLPLRDGAEILLRDTPDKFAEAVVKLLKDKSFAGKIGEQAAQTVREKFGWQKVADDFAQLCEQAIEVRRPNR
ncbi:MAG: glycosyltransferase [Pyrinomonadaceae bacterium]|nr:glycosyltransferase [Pyrinomonadaceae bacterium]